LEKGVGQTRRIVRRRDSSSLRRLGDELPAVEFVNFIAERARRHVRARTWIRVSWRWSTGNCDELASIARELLRVRGYLHQKVGDAVEGVLAQYDWPKVPKLLVRELAERLPLPVDEPLIALARTVQMIGIHLCVIMDVDECPCARDLSRALLSEVGKLEVREQLMNLDRCAIENWL
jgi:hypothetical protein